MKRFIQWLSRRCDINDGVFIHVTQDKMGANRMAKALDMAIVIHELQANAWRRYKYEEPKTDFVTAYLEIINEIYEEHGIIPEELSQ